MSIKDSGGGKDIIKPVHHEIRGAGYERMIQQEIEQRFFELTGHIEEAEKRGVPLAKYMAGQDKEGNRFEAINLRQANVELQNAYGLKHRREKHSLARQVYDPTQLEPVLSKEDELSQAWERCKFYLSLDGEATADVQEFQKDFLVVLARTALERGIYFSWKIEDHSYDSPDIYTNLPRELEQIIAELYVHYPENMWRAVPRIFQHPCNGVPPEYVGIVQEPEKGYNGSHSTRMNKLAKLIESFGSNVTLEQYSEACRSIGVRPEAPWRLTNEAMEQYYLERQGIG